MRPVCLFLILLLCGLAARAQEDKKDRASVVKKDTTTLIGDSTKTIGGKKVINIESYAKRFDPRKAMFYAAILPGAGQAYNKKYWKIPLVYGGLAGLLAVVNFYNSAEVKYKNQLYFLINNPTLTYAPGGTRTIDQLRITVDLARRQRDYFVIFTGLFYILQMVDAHVDAHLKEFDLNPQMHVRIEPSMGPGQSVGMGITIRF